MTKILLTRHGHVEGITPERFRGREPLKLTARGRAEAAALAQRIAGTWRPRCIYSSPLGRCVETATAIAKACGITVQSCDDLNDIDYGAWQFKTFADAEAQDPLLFAAWFATPHLVRLPNGETLQDLAARVADTVRMVLARHPDETVVLVGHDSVNRALLLGFLDLPVSAYWRIAQTPCCLNEIAAAGGKFCVERLNETLHLETVARDHDAR
ncbi:MAG TPA: histidine phosphatase family protein [Xanthobacteraceae bacterium]|nr:histidine phosphatase family protein [Xanthobacteraceae bacterium]